MKIERIDDINEENIKDLTPEELVDLKMSLEDMIDEIDNFLENYEEYSEEE